MAVETHVAEELATIAPEIEGAGEDGQAAQRVLFSCVSENKPEWFDRVINLALSVRTFGGPLADAPVVVNFVGGADSAMRRILADLGAEVRVVERFDARTPYANKLRMLEMVEDHNFDILLALDCDVIVVGDVTPYLSTTHVAAKPADRDRLTDQQWDALFGALGVPLPKKSVVATSSGTPMRPYFNSGVVVVPAAQCRRLLASWTGSLDDTLLLLDRRPELVPTQWHIHSDQFSLAATLLRDHFPTLPLPLSMNFPTHIGSKPELVAAAGSPVILHYHKDMNSEGLIMRSRAEVANGLIARFNAARANHFQLPDPGVPEVPVSVRARRVAVRGVQAIRGYRHRVGIAIGRGSTHRM